MTDTDHTDYYARLIASALEELHAAISALVEDTQPSTPLPRLRRFEIVPGIVWPQEGQSKDQLSSVALFEGRWINWHRLAADRDRRVLTSEICQACQNQPRLILRALRRIQAATAWCLARAEGRRRAAQEILRQQQAAQEVLDVEVVLVALKQ